jgi:hypothetical protein
VPNGTFDDDRAPDVPSTRNDRLHPGQIIPVAGNERMSIGLPGDNVSLDPIVIDDGCAMMVGRGMRRCGATPTVGTNGIYRLCRRHMRMVADAGATTLKYDDRSRCLVRCLFCHALVSYDLELSANLNNATGCTASPHGLHVGDPESAIDRGDEPIAPSPIDSDQPASLHGAPRGKR